MGAGSSLHDAARQLLGGSKLGEEGRLLRKFSLSPKPPTWKEVENDPDWKAFVYQYNAQDAYLSALLGIELNACAQ